MIDMSYEFRKRGPKLKHKFNKREKIRNKKLDLKSKKIKQRDLIDQQGLKSEDMQKLRGEDMDLTWENIVIDITKQSKQGIVAGKRGNLFDVLDEETEQFILAEVPENIPSHLRNDFVVGDIIVYIHDNGKNIIQKRNIRQNYLSRTRSNTSRFGSQKEQIIASNIDIAVIVIPVKEPEFDHKLLDRYLVLCNSWGVTPLVCINKIDLTDRRHPLLVEYKKSGISILEISVEQNKGIDGLKQILKNKTSVLLGKSGVGKSSLINILYPDGNLLTQEVNQKSGEGKHTTTSSSLYKRDNKSYIVDTPGVRALGLDQIARTELKNYFPEFLKYKGKCKYSRCIHDIEPDCAIKNAVENSEIEQYRYDSYIRILGDLV